MKIGLMAGRSWRLSTLWAAGAVAMAALLVCASNASAQDAPKKQARMLMVTQSKGFKHGSVNRKDGQLAPSERAVTEIGVSSNLFRVDCTQDAAADFTKNFILPYSGRWLHFHLIE